MRLTNIMNTTTAANIIRGLSILMRVDRYPIKAVANPKPIIFLIEASTILKKTFLCSSLFIYIFLPSDRGPGAGSLAHKYYVGVN